MRGKVSRKGAKARRITIYFAPRRLCVRWIGYGVVGLADSTPLRITGRLQQRLSAALSHGADDIDERSCAGGVESFGAAADGFVGGGDLDNGLVEDLRAAAVRF